jgi:hypothetical protein
MYKQYLVAIVTQYEVDGRRVIKQVTKRWVSCTAAQAWLKEQTNTPPVNGTVRGSIEEV